MHLNSAVYGPTLLERLVLDSLESGARPLDDLCLDVGLREQDLQRVLVDLMQKGLIVMEQGELSLAKMKSERNRNELRWEAKDLINGMVDYCCEQPGQREEVQKNWDFSLQKLAVTPSEMRMLNVLFHNLHSFISKLEKSDKETSQGKKKVLVALAHAPFQEVVEQVLQQL